MNENTIKKAEIKTFLHKDNSTLNTFRTLTLFGKNAATYKFALCHALLKRNSQSSELRYEDLQEDFLRELIRHYEINPHQFSRRENSLTREIDLYIKSEKTTSDWSQLSTEASKSIFNDVFRAYQNVGAGTLADSYLLFEDQRKSKKIIMTDRLLSVLENDKAKQIISIENQARWCIVEEAWRSGLAANMLSYNQEDGLFYSESENQRIGLRSAVDTLLPYQNGRCFYCNRKISKFALSHCDDFADVDHFFPISMVSRLSKGVPNPNGVWNLVIACKKCNRGQGGKFDAPPANEYYESLVTRNILFFEEHRHSLKNAICLSLNVKNKQELINRLKNVHDFFKQLTGWRPVITFHTED